MMAEANDSRERIEVYLSRLRRCLRAVNDRDARDIIEELRSHVMDKVAATGIGVEAALAALGSPEELASDYVMDARMVRAEISRSPVGILSGLFSWASLSVAGFSVLLTSIIGYSLGIILIIPAALKPFHPQNSGLWVSRDMAGDLDFSLRLGFGSGGVPSNARDVLGWWFMPIGLLVGGGLVMLTTRLALWCVRQYRRSRALPRG
jgi:hypothetical protein